MILHYRGQLGDLLDYIRRNIPGYLLESEYYQNYDLNPDSWQIAAMPKVESFIEYGNHRGTLYRLHKEIEPLIGELTMHHDYHAGSYRMQVYIRIADLTRMKMLLMTSRDVRMQISHVEYEIVMTGDHEGKTCREYREKVKRLLQSVN